MTLPCTTCKYKTENKQGFRNFIGCKDEERKKANFHYDNWSYHHDCDGYEQEDKL